MIGLVEYELFSPLERIQQVKNILFKIIQTRSKRIIVWSCVEIYDTANEMIRRICQVKLER